MGFREGAERREELVTLIDSALAGKADLANPAVWYAVQVLEALRVWEDYHLPPEPGGYLDQPLILTHDMDAAHTILYQRRIEHVQSSRLTQEILAKSVRPDVPLPPIPKELLCRTPPKKS